MIIQDFYLSLGYKKKNYKKRKMTKLEALELIPCPKCGKLFPKGRVMLGYKFCVDCTPQTTVRPVIEGIMDGEDVCDVMHIVSQQEYNSIMRGQRMLHGGSINPDETLDYSTFEQQDEITQSLSPAEQEARMEAIELNQQGLNETTLEELETVAEECNEEEDE